MLAACGLGGITSFSLADCEALGGKRDTSMNKSESRVTTKLFKQLLASIKVSKNK